MQSIYIIAYSILKYVYVVYLIQYVPLPIIKLSVSNSLGHGNYSNYGVLYFKSFCYLLRLKWYEQLECRECICRRLLCKKMHIMWCIYISEHYFDCISS